jgi:hypothetical protein
MADFDAQLPVRALAVNFTTEVANAAGTTINPAEDYAQGSTTSGENNVLAGGATTTAAPTYVTATTNPLSLDTAGNLRVLTGTGSTTAVTGNVTVVQPTGTNLHAVIDNFPADTDALAQGSTTSGQLGSLVMGAVTTAAPTDVTGTTNPLSMDTSGNLRVTVSGVTPPLPAAVLTYFTDTAVASNATVTHSLAGPTNLDAIHGSGSGEIKMTIAIGVTASEVTLWNGFTSAAGQNCEFYLKNTYVIPVGSSAKVTLTNRDKAAQDLYLTFVSH